MIALSSGVAAASCPPSMVVFQFQGEFAATAADEWKPEPGAIKAHNNSVDVFERDGACRWLIVRSLNYPL